MKYEYECEECGVTDCVDYPMGQAPEAIICLCGGQMSRVFSCNFILKGSDWPGKEVGKQRDKEHKDQKFQNEMLTERRQGTEHWKEFQKKNPDKAKRYTENLKRGVKGE
jgi:predicted nucleic acid-binding Zn ribbon protein